MAEMGSASEIIHVVNTVYPVYPDVRERRFCRRLGISAGVLTTPPE